MNSKIINPYMHIELSTDSEPEDNIKQVPGQGEKENKQKKIKNKVVKVSQTKKDEAIIKSAKTIRNKLDIGDLISTSDEFEKLLAEIAKMKKGIELEGLPLSFLQILDHLNDVIVLGKTGQDFKKKKDLSKQLNLIKKKISTTFKSYEDEINEAKASPDFYKEETIEEEKGVDVADKQLIDQAALATEEQGEAFDLSSESEEEQDDMDFSKRLLLNKEDRRKFWLVKIKDKKDQGKKPEKKRRAPKIHTDKTAGVKKFADEDEEFKSIDLSILAIQKRLRDIYEKKMMYKDEEVSDIYRLLTYVYENLSNDKLKTETLILILNFQLELIKNQGIVVPEFWEECFDNIKKLFHSIKDKNLKLTNYIKGIDVEFDRSDLIRYFNGFISQLNNEIIYTLKLSDPFDENFTLRITHEIEFVGFLFEVNEFYKSQLNKDNQSKYLIDMAFKITEHIYHVSNDFVINSDKLSKLFESQDITSVVNDLSKYVYQNCQEENLIVKMQLYQSFNQALNLESIDEATNLLISALETRILTKDRYLVSLFNRCLAVLGTGQFKLGNLEKCKFFLFELVNSENMEALLYQYNPNTTNVLDFNDPLCMFPYHMHINLEEVEAAFLLASILTESHKTVNFQNILSKSVVNKKMIKFIENYQKNLFINSLNNIFDQIFICYRKIVQYDYVSAFEAVKKIKYLSNQDNYTDSIKQKVKVECFNCYIEKMKSENRSVINIEDFAGVFDIEISQFKSLLRNKVDQGDLNGSLKESEGVLVVDNGLSEVLQTESDFELFETLKSFNDLNGLVSNIKFEKSAIKSGDAHEISHFIHKRFENQDKYFNFTYDFSYFKKLLG
jgi:hypothetical protein